MQRATEYRRLIGGLAALAVALTLWFGPALPGLPVAGQHALALGSGAVIAWATAVAHPGYVSLLLLAAYVLLDIAPAPDLLQLWTGPLVYLVVAGFLIARAVERSGLGRRLAYLILGRTVRSYRSLIVSIYLTSLLLTPVIPHPFARAFLLAPVVAALVDRLELPPADTAAIGLAVFAAQAATSHLVLTGNSILNPAAVQFTGRAIDWLDRFRLMGVPGLAVVIGSLFVHLLVFRPKRPFHLDGTFFRDDLARLGPLSGAEKRTALWMTGILLLWATDSLHGLSPAWIGLIGAVGLALPVVGGVLDGDDFAAVPLGTLFFITGAVAIGTAGAASGLNDWLGRLLLPDVPPAGPWAFGALAIAVSLAAHFTLGSSLAVMGLIVPTLSQYAAAAGFDPIFPALIVYTIVVDRWIFPFQQIDILVGVGETGRYGAESVVRLGLALTVAIPLVTLVVHIPWWMQIGFLR